MGVIINTSAKITDEYGAGIHGFDVGDPQAGRPPTQLSADWCDGVQQETNNAILTAPLSIDNSDRTQLAQSIDAQIRTRKPRFGGVVVDTWCSEPSPSNATWLRRERSQGLTGVSNNTVQNLLAMTLPSNSQASFLVRGSIVQFDSITNYTNYAAFASVRNAAGVYTVQGTAVLLNDNIAGVTMAVVVIGAALYLRFTIPVLVGKSFNLFATGSLENVTRS